MKCPRCKKQLRKGAKFCPACGAKIEKRRVRPSLILWIIIMLLSLVVIGWSGGILLAKHFGGNFKDLFSGKKTVEIRSVEEAITHAKELGGAYGYENALSELTEKVTTAIDGDTYYRLQQNYRGIPVYGKTAVYVVNEENQVISITGSIQDVDEHINLIPTVSIEEVEKSIVAYLNETLGLERRPTIEIDELREDQLYIFFNSDKQPILSYLINTDTYDLVVDANSAQILSCRQTVSASSTKTSKYGSENSILGWQNHDGMYILRDEERNIYIYDANNQTYWDPNENKMYPEVLSLVSSEDNVFGNDNDSTTTVNVAISYLHLLQRIYDYYKIDLNESGFGILCAIYNDKLGSYNGENAGGGIESVAGALPGTPPDYDNSKFNGKTAMITTGTAYCANLYEHVNLLGHEYTHFVSSKYADWMYSWNINKKTGAITETYPQTGAIDEALSDIFGEIIEEKIGSGMDWENGDRIIHDPSENGYPERIDQGEINNKGWLIVKNGTDSTNYSHGYSTVISHAAYLMWHGLDGNVSKQICTDDLAKLWYRAMLMMPADCDFATCRQMVEWAAFAVDGITDEQRACIAEAFDRVGIEDVTLPPEILVDCNQNVRPNSVLNVYNVEGELHPRYTLNITGTVAERELAYAPNILSDIGYRYESTEEITKAKSYHLDLPNGYYTFNVTDSNNPMYSYTFTVSVSDQGTDNIIELYTDFEDKLVVKVSDPPKSNAYETYISAARKTTETGSWSEHLIMTANMAITDGSAKTKTKVTLTSDANVSHYSENDPSQIRMSGSAEMTIMGQTYAWDVEYENGTAHYRYTKPNQTSADMTIDPSFFNFGTMTSDMMSNAKISGDKITFTVPGEKIAEVGIAAVNQMSGVDNLEYGDVDVTVTISDDGKIENIIMVFYASMKYQGYNADVDYDITYQFSDTGEVASNNDANRLDIQLPNRLSCITVSLRANWVIMPKENGTFRGTFTSNDWGYQGPEYPKGTCYLKEISGVFSEVEKLNDYSYRMVVDKIEKTAQAGESYISDGVRYIVEDGTGIDNGDEFYLFLPGTPQSLFPQGLVDSVNNNGYHTMDEITSDTYVMYRPDPESYGYEFVFIGKLGIMPTSIPVKIDPSELQNLADFDLDGFWRSTDNRYVYHIYAGDSPIAYNTLCYIDLSRMDKVKFGQVNQTSSYSINLSANEDSGARFEVFAVDNQLKSDEITLVRANDYVRFVGTWKNDTWSYRFDADGKYYVTRARGDSFWGYYFVLDNSRIVMTENASDCELREYKIEGDSLWIDNMNVLIRA